MIDLPSDIEDRESYLQVDLADRWIFNKLTVAERLGYTAGPCGTPVPAIGDYCVRPSMNCAGNGIGGVVKFTATRDDPDAPFLPGYFWSDWADGQHGWIDFTDDVPVLECYGDEINGRLDHAYRTDNFTIPTLPPALQGLSKHLLVEYIGNTIIEVSPRHMDKAGYLANGVAMTYMQKARMKLAWGFDAERDELDVWYWRTVPL